MACGDLLDDLSRLRALRPVDGSGDSVDDAIMYRFDSMGYANGRSDEFELACVGGIFSSGTTLKALAGDNT